MSTVLWLALPYVAFTSFVLGHIWRYRHDQFGWTTRSSQLYEGRLLRLGSPLFHFGLLAVIGGHAMGILIPASWTAAVGISDHAYHLVSVTAGTLSGVATMAGLAILLYRRFTVPAVRKATTANDKIMYALLVVAILTGMVNTVGENLIGGGYDYRATVSVWFRSLFSIAPQPELMTGVPLSFQVHNVMVLALLAVWPYTRLVHVFSAPLGYLVRPYVVYRSRDPKRPDARPYARAWETPSKH
ncbi:respiratory nitrate reductase gamma subunit [Actinokineospora alba]|uniref:Nitrate reductase-like protein NarX n=1 Tax=Actinokineospora alba TaxID=504798 RepID=A0A1H0LJA0_9PSEU|nr:respiratory nitrate reductase subunit gamma [Actinokineospora alba]TDP67343.1 respiratory nitrate reductase gamma subunit [Actinokineospora alba]SDI99651.1 nitrate reductase gamma subunit [Actinokineospora alba]SDO68101.1 respiratory nitrate reductase gamma subunit [Actinokineospora alba]